MNLRDIKFKKCYNSDKDKPLEEFYIPVLGTAKHYKRITGSFTSGILSLAARGIAGLITNEGKMQLIAGVQINEDDYKSMENATINPEKYIEDIISKDIGEIENFLRNDHTEALAWMLANDFLEIKIAVAPHDKLSHMKVGIIEDTEGNSLSFSGSNNETPSGWEYNIEEFKVFREWDEGEKVYFEDDAKKFNDLWEGKAKRAKVYNLPSAIRERIIKNVEKGTLPRIYENKKNFVSETEMQAAFRKARERMERTKSINEEKKPRDIRDISLHKHQAEAVTSWMKNNKLGILGMATGTGKTVTAIACIDKLWSDNNAAIVVAVPTSHLISQWVREFLTLAERGSLESFSEISKITTRNIIITGSTNPRWRKELRNRVLEINTEELDRLIILTTHKTAAKEGFISHIDKLKPETMIVVDEAHGTGASKNQEALVEKYKYRLGLSATPKRWLDDEGSEIINKYFGGTVSEFSLEEAINTTNPATGKTYLTPYNYFPCFVELTDDEADEYRNISGEISRLLNYKDDSQEMKKRLDLLKFKRANIIKSAQNKLPELRAIIQDIKKDNLDINHTFIYCNPGAQFEEVLDILIEERIPSKEFTHKTGTKKSETYGGISERDYLLEEFSKKNIKVLVAMKCLDEGVDVPAAQYGILLASSSNPREYVQRRGRLMRRAEGKDVSNIYDAIVLPPLTNAGEVDKVMYKKEMARYQEFAGIAKNSAECLLELIAKEKDLGLTL
jgi:superfamily II DNA or RNA helicase